MRKAAIGCGVIAAYLLSGAGALSADLGGGGLADLEERIAELEASTVRKGNRKVTVKLSGYVSHSIMWWDDGGMTDMYVGDGGNMSSRFRLEGLARINNNVSAGFLYEFGVANNTLGAMNQTAGGDDLGGSFTLRDSTVWMAHKQLGKVKLGFGSTATDNLILTDVSNSGVATTADVALYNGGFFLRSTLAGGNLVPLTWGNILNQGVSFDTARRNHVSYTSPVLGGFELQAAVGEDNFWDVALRYAGEFGGFRVAGGIGYSVDTEAPLFHTVIPATDLKTYMGSLSIKHMVSGLFVTGAAAKRDVGWAVSFGANTIAAKDMEMWHVRGGIEKNFFGIGNTTVFAGYHSAEDAVGFTWTNPAFGINVSSEAHVMEAGIVQAIDAAAMDLFLTYKKFDGDIKITSTPTGALNNALGVQDFSAVIGGARIQF